MTANLGENWLLKIIHSSTCALFSFKILFPNGLKLTGLIKRVCVREKRTKINYRFPFQCRTGSQATNKKPYRGEG